MSNNINSAPSNVDNGYMLKSSVNLDYTNESEVGLSVEIKAAAEKNTVVNIAEQVKTENKVNKQQEKEVSENEIDQALEVVSSFMNNSNKQVAFSNDNSSGKTIIIITDKKTQEVINQFPSEKLISMAERIQNLHREAESISGLLIDSRV